MEKTTKQPKDKHQRAREIVGWYTLAATGVGAVPVPATSVAVVANNGFMLAHIGATMGTVVTWEGVVCSLGIAGTLNIAGRAVFLEVGKALSWGTGSVWALAALSAAGATTAGLQTYILGLIAIEMAQNGGKPIDTAEAARVIAFGKKTWPGFVKEMQGTKLSDPGLPSVEAQAQVEVTSSPSLDGKDVVDKLRALSVLEGVGTSIMDAAVHAAEVVGAGAGNAGSAVKGLAVGTADAVGSVLQRKKITAQVVDGAESGEALERPDSLDV